MKYNQLTNKNKNNIVRKTQLNSIYASKNPELARLKRDLSIYILTKLKLDRRTFNTPVSESSYGIVYNNSINGSIKVKFQKIYTIDNVFDIYLEYLIMNILYSNSSNQYKKSIPKPYYIYQNQEYIRIYIRNIENSYTLNDYINEVI